MTRLIPWREPTVALLSLALTLACSSSSTDSTMSSGAGSQVQALPSIAFSPPSLTIAVGGSVTWVFGSVGHTVTFDSAAGAPANIGSVDSPQANTSALRTFTTVGTFSYHCSIHPSMTGTIVVGEGGAVVPPPPPPPPPPAGYLKLPS